MHRYVMNTPDGDMAAIDFGDPSLDMAALWLHATGFNGMTYKSLLEPLSERHRITALDMRGHGCTTLPAEPKSLKSWKTYRDDVIAFLEQTVNRPVVLGGHSMGGCVSMLVAGKRPDLVAGLVLVDPVVLTPQFYFRTHLLSPFKRLLGGNQMARQARKRRAEFRSPEAAHEAYRGKGAFKTWREPFLEDYIQDGFKRVAPGTESGQQENWRLTCEPGWEAATFAGQRNRPWKALKKIRKADIPVVLFRPNVQPVLTNKMMKRMVSQYPALVLKERPGATHFHPMEVPYEVRDELARNISYLIDGYSPSDEGPMRRSLRGNH